MLKGILSQKTLIQMFPELVDNPDEELKAVGKEAKEAVKNMMLSVEEPTDEEDKDNATDEKETEEEIK
jgi:hypothetical protein